MKAICRNIKFKNLLLMTIILLNFTFTLSKSHAGDRLGNGGSGNEALAVSQQAQVETVALKIKHFFQNNSSSLSSVFTEFSIEDLIKIIETSKIKIVEKEELIDKDGISRTCLNFPENHLIECKLSGINQITHQPDALFVLIFHEILGLIGVEETSPIDPKILKEYTVSKKIAGFVTKINNYELVIQEEHDPRIITIKKFYRGVINSTGEQCSLVVTEEARTLQQGFFYYADIRKGSESLIAHFYLGNEKPQNSEENYIINNRSELCLDLGICMFDFKNQVVKISFQDKTPTSFIYSTEKADNSYTRKPLFSCENLTFVKEKTAAKKWENIKEILK